MSTVNDAPPSSSRGWRLTVYFALLVALVSVAAAAATVYVFVQTDRDSRSTAKKDARYAADLAAKQLGDGIAIIRSTVATLAATPNIDQAALDPTCSLAFSIDNDGYRGHLDVLRPDGSVACSSRRPPGSPPVAGYKGAEWLSQLTAGELFSAPVLDDVTHDQSVLVAMPTPGHGAVVSFLALEPVGPALRAEHGGGRPTEFLIASDDGTILSRSSAPNSWIGKSLADTELATAGVAGERRDLDGTPRFYQEAAIGKTGWRLLVGEDKHATLAAGHRLRERQLWIILAGLALVLLATFAVYRRVAVPIKRLGAAVRSTSETTPLEPVPASGPAEVADLGDDVNGLISAVNDELGRRQRAEEKALRSERSYRQMFESSPLPTLIYDAKSLAILEANEAAVSCYGYSREEFLVLTMTNLTGSARSARPDAVLLERSEVVRHRAKGDRMIDVRTIAHPLSFYGRDAFCVVAEVVSAVRAPAPA